MELKEKLINFSIDDVFRQEVIENRREFSSKRILENSSGHT